MIDSRILSTYVTYKQLYSNKGTDVYDIISEFARYVILEEQQTSYSQLTFSSLIKKYFDFEIPTLVLKPAIKRIKGITLANKEYRINYSIIETHQEFKVLQNEAIENTNLILEDLTQYICKKTGISTVSIEEKENITTSFRKFILDESSNGQYDAYISAFIMESSTDINYTRKINQIREGHILYNGLCQNEAITSRSWDKPLTIYLDTEIIFHIAGYNGITFQKLAEEFLDLVSYANKDKTIIKLKYFIETEDEINRFFSTAENLFENKKVLRPNETAMLSILDNCKSTLDITNKKSSLFFNLNKAHITLEKKSDFYLDKYKVYNLESSDYCNTPDEKNIQQLSHINKLRGNNLTSDYSKCLALLVSENSSVLDHSRIFTNENKSNNAKRTGRNTDVTQLAINLYTATNIIWYKLNRSLAKDFIPSTINSVIRAQIVLSKYINESISDEYDRIMELYQKGQLEQEELASIILGMRQHSSKPEKIMKEGVDDALNLICERDINKYKENIELERQAHKDLELKYNDTLKQLAASQEDLSSIKEQLEHNQVQNTKISLEYEFEKLENIQQWLQIYKSQYKIQQDKAKKSLKIRSAIVIISYLLFYGIIIFLIFKLGWNTMEPVTYLLGLPLTIYLFVSNLIDFKLSLKTWISSYKSNSTYSNAQKKYNEYLKKENDQKRKIKSMKEN